MKAAKSLVDFLNMPETLLPDSEDKEAVAKVKAMLLSMNELQRKAMSGTRVTTEELVPINDVLTQYQWITRMTGVSNKRIYFENQPAELRTDYISQWLAENIVHLAQHGLVAKIRRCRLPGCLVWFLAIKGKKVCCTTKHYQKLWRSQPRVKQRRRKLARDYYRDVLSPVTSKLLRAKLRRKAS